MLGRGCGGLTHRSITHPRCDSHVVSPTSVTMATAGHALEARAHLAGFLSRDRSEKAARPVLGPEQNGM